MPFKGIKKALFVTGLAFGFAASSSAFAGVKLKCNPASVELVKHDEEKSITFEGERQTRAVYVFKASQSCDVVGASSSGVSKLASAYKSVLKSYKRPLDPRKPKKRLETFKVKRDLGDSLDMIHTKPTENGIMTLEASLDLSQTSRGFKTVYKVDGEPKKVDSYHLKKEAKFTFGIVEEAEIKKSSGGYRVEFERDVTIVRPKIAGHDIFMKHAPGGVKDDMASLVDFHKAVYDKAF